MRTPTPIADQLFPQADAIEIQRRAEKQGRKGGGTHRGQSRILWAGDLAWIELTQNKFALIDAVDIHLVAVRMWHASFERDRWYAMGSGGVRMHRLIIQPPTNCEIDHHDGNGLHNRRGNLRICSKTQNMQNTKLRKNNATGFKGVSLHRPSGRYMASIKINGRSIYLGLFDTPEQAHEAYRHSALEHFVEFARFS